MAEMQGVIVHKRLEFIEPAVMCDVLAGYFTYCEADGTQVEAEFYVHCCVEDEQNPTVRSERQDALNEQFMDQWSALQLSGCQNIKFRQANPNPFF